MKLRQNDLRGRLAFLGHDVGRYATTVIGNGNGAVGVNTDVDFGAVSGERLVDRVVYNFVDEVVKAVDSGRADIHSRPFPNRFKAFQNFNLIRAIGSLAGWLRGLFWTRRISSFRHDFYIVRFAANVQRNKG